MVILSAAKPLSWVLWIYVVLVGHFQSLKKKLWNKFQLKGKLKVYLQLFLFGHHFETSQWLILN